MNTYKKTETGIKTLINTFQLEILFYADSTVRILKYPEGEKPDKKSLSVINPPQAAAFSVMQEKEKLTLKSDKLLVAVNLKNGRISFESINGLPLLSEKPSGAKFTDFDDAGEKTYSVQQSFVLEKDEYIYGLGILQNGKMSQRGIKVRMVQTNTLIYIPFFQSNKGYGIFWDNYSPTTFSDTPAKTTFISEVGDCIDYYFMYGTDSDGVIAGMRSLTGRAPMFPLWTFGYWQSKERYKSQDETVGVVKKYRSLGVPLDGIIQDWRYWGNNYLWNAMEFLDEGFTDPQKMVNEVHG